jgi:hypothetical protein
LESRRFGFGTADYDIKATFAKGDANIHVVLIKHGDNWQIMGFRVNSPALLPK